MGAEGVHALVVNTASLVVPVFDDPSSAVIL